MLPTRTFLLWRNAILFSILLVIVCFFYIVTFDHHPTPSLLSTLNQSLANAGMILIGLSFLFSSICYFWNFFDKKIIYRKYIGLMGFWLIVLHGILTLALPQFPLAAFFLPENIVAFLAAVDAFLILLMMAFISHRSVIKKIGGRRWRILLRTGYIAYAFGIIHLALKKYPLWVLWVGNFPEHLLPPLSLLVTFFAFLVFLLRIALFISLKRSAPQPPIIAFRT